MILREIIEKDNKFKNIADLINLLDLILDLAREDVFKIAKAKRIVFSDFDFTFADAVEILKKQLNKKHLKAIERFYNCENISSSISWLVERLLNNMRNITTNKKYKLYCSPEFVQLHDNIEFDNDYYEIIDLREVDTGIILIGLKKVYGELKYNSDFNFEDFEELCCKFGFTSNEVVGSHTFEEPKLSKYEVETGQFQLQLLF